MRLRIVVMFRWLVDAYSPLHGPVALPALLAPFAAPVALAAVAVVHELLTGATGQAPGRIAIAYFAYLTSFSFVLSLFLGTPLALIWDRLLNLPRCAFVAAAGMLAALFGWVAGLAYAALVLGLAGALNAALYVTIGDALTVRNRPAPAEPDRC